MFSHNHYVPILKGRDGEYGALQTLASNVRVALTPLLELPPIPWDYEEEAPAKTIDQHLRTLQLWSSEGAPPGELRGHESGVKGALALANGRLLS